MGRGPAGTTGTARGEPDGRSTRRTRTTNRRPGSVVRRIPRTPTTQFGTTSATGRRHAHSGAGAREQPDLTKMAHTFTMKKMLQFSARTFSLVLSSTCKELIYAMDKDNVLHGDNAQHIVLGLLKMLFIFTMSKRHQFDALFPQI